MENNAFNETSEEMNPGKQALDRIAGASQEDMPEKWLEKFDAAENEASEKDQLSGDKKPDSIFLYFKAINPLGLKVADLKKELLGHIEHLKQSIHDSAIDESLSSKERDELAKDLERRIQEKEVWIERIDYFLANDTLQPYDDSPLLEHKKQKVERIIEQQKHPEQN